MSRTNKITINDPKYPSLLKKIENPPKTFYVRGQIPSGPCFAIVGTRRCSAYGKQIALEIASELTSAGLIIVSGMAKGIDTMAHKGCLETNGKTIAVLGTGLDDKSIYPQENLKLAHKIIETEGCLISEYPSGTFGRRENFPQRNRVISGLSLGVLVVEAKQKSGALITAHWAQKQKRKLFAIPGPVHSLNSKGPHSLIKNGAYLVENVNDILKVLELNSWTSHVQPEIKSSSPEEVLILKVLQENPLHIEKIIEQTSLPAQKILSMLSIMEIRNLIRNLGGNVYALKR